MLAVSHGFSDPAQQNEPFTTRKAVEQSAYSAYYDPAKGFKPAQHNLTKAFLQLAGSLEATASPEPYIRHVLAEHTRIEAKFKAATGKSGSSRPTYLTDAYVENLLRGWKKLEGPLKLDALCRESGRNMRYAIMGSWNKSISEQVDQEAALSAPERLSFSNLLVKPSFTRADFHAMESFYKDSFDKLTEEGKDQISTRTKLGQLPEAERTEFLRKRSSGGTALVEIFNNYQDKLVPELEGRTRTGITSDTLENELIKHLHLSENAPSGQSLSETEFDAFKYSQLIRAGFQKRFDLAFQNLPKDQAKEIQKALTLMAENLLVIAHSEYEAAVRESWIDGVGKK